MAAVAGVDHRLHGDGHTPQQTGSMAGLAVIGDFGCLMHLVSDAVTDIFPDDAEAVGLHIRLHSGREISRQAIALAGILYALEKALLGHPDQPQRLVGHLTAG